MARASAVKVALALAVVAVEVVARHIHRDNIKVPTVSILCYTCLQDAWQTDGQRHNTIQSPCVTEM